jgi:uncharacterized membrane protein HdeD (DUF308 family)
VTSSDRAGVLLAVLITAVFCGLGVITIWTEFHTRRTRGGVEIVLQGNEAVLFGWLLIFVGLLPLMLLMHSRRARRTWFFIALFIGLSGSAYTLLR